MSSIKDLGDHDLSEGDEPRARRSDRRCGGVEAGEVLLDGGDDPLLLPLRRKW
jgi:hypothetical protein